LGLSHLIFLSQDAERYLSTLVSNGTITAKIDRPAKVVVFQPKKRAVDILNHWTESLR
jgi:26S proteasome regulatory subunit N5